MKNGTPMSGAAARQLREKYDRERQENEELKHEIEYYEAEEHTKVHELKAKFDKRLEEKDAEIDKYKALYYGLLGYSPPSSQKSASSPRAKPGVDVKGYLLPTKSSKSRQEAVKSKKSRPAPHRRVPTRQDKTCPTCGSHPDHEYHAWLAAALPNVRNASTEINNNDECDTCNEWDDFTPRVEECLCGGRPCGQSPCVQKWVTPTQCTCNVCTRFDQARYREFGRTPRELENDVCQRTRLQDSGFWTTPASRVNVSHKTEVRLLHAGLRLAQNALWHAARTEWPNFQRKNWPHGSTEVKFGRDETRSLFLTGEYLNEYNELCGMPRFTVWSAVTSMNHLRNAVAHPRYLSPARVDELLKSAQELACVLFDESRARQIRKLRDQLREQAEKAFEEIIRFEPLSHLPGTKHWALHHQALFDEVVKEMRGSQSLQFRLEVQHLCRPIDVPVESFYHPSVVHAAVSWTARFQSPGSNIRYPWERPDSQPNVAFASDEAVRLVRSGGRDNDGNQIRMESEVQ